MTHTRTLLLVRHGNTFAPGDRIVWVGANQDFPLVKRGQEQAQELRAVLERVHWTPDTAVSGGLTRQVEHIDLAAPRGVPRTVDARLGELDYGPWGGLSTDEIIERDGPSAIEGWNERSEWPDGAGWPESLESVRARVAAFAQAVAEGAFGNRVLACSSNGLMRWFLELVPGALQSAVADGAFKVGTGRTCLLRLEGNVWKVGFWNRAPGDIEEPFE